VFRKGTPLVLSILLIVVPVEGLSQVADGSVGLRLEPTVVQNEPGEEITTAPEGGEFHEVREPHAHYVGDEVLVEFLGSLANTISETSQDLATHSLWVQVFISVVLAVVGLGMLFFQLRAERKYENERAWLEREVGKEREALKDWRATTRSELRELLSKEVGEAVAEAVPGSVGRIFSDVYEEKIERRVLDYSSEVLLQTPSARGLLLARMRRLTEVLEASWTDQPPDSAEPRIGSQLMGAVQDWHTLGQLYSPDREQLEKGLLAVSANPFLEAEPRLRQLRARYSEDPDLVSLVSRALKSFE